jgi:glycosyltransferase involved in cell wall biosynthesis
MTFKKISIVGSVGLPANYGGWETLSSNLAQQLSSHFEMTVFCSSKRYSNRLKECNGAKLKYIKLNANGIQSIPYDIISIYKSLKFADTILILGVSGCIFLPISRLFGRSKIIVNIDGLEWKRDKWGKIAKLFLKFSEFIGVKFADIVVTDNIAIQKYVLENYKVSSEFIPYGGNHAQKIDLKLETSNKYKFVRDKYAFTVCRIEPENNIDLILEAFESFSSIPIVIVGNWSNSNYGLKLKLKYLDSKDMYLLDPIYDQDKLDILRSNCSIYIHGHSAGGTNPSLVEAMNLGLAIIAYDVTYNRETTQNKSLYFNNANQLSEILSSLDKINLSKISSDMKIIADEHYTWVEVSKKYAKLF